MLPIPLDVTDRVADFQAVKKAANYLGKLDVVVNNAGYGAPPVLAVGFSLTPSMVSATIPGRQRPFLTVRSKIPSVARRADSGTIGKRSLRSPPTFDQS